MSDYFYMRAVHTYRDGRLETYGDQRGSVTTDPVAVHKRYRLAHEKYMRQEFGLDSPRAGKMFATWLLPAKMARDEAQAYARKNPPHRVYILTSDHGWRMIGFVLPQGEEIHIEDYRDDGYYDRRAGDRTAGEEKESTT